MSKSDLVASLGSPTFKAGDEIVINFNDGVISTGGEINIKESKNGQLVEKFQIGSETMKGGIYSFNGMLFDYEYNNVALSNDSFFPNLAKSNNLISVSERSNDEWANDLRLLWNVSIDGKLFTLSDNGWDYQTDNDYSYHSTSPEYTPGVDNSGLSDFVLSPLGGIKQLTIKPSKSLQTNTSYEVDLSSAGLLSAAGDLNDYLKFDKPLNFKLETTARTPDEIAKEAVNLLNTYSSVDLTNPYITDLVGSRDFSNTLIMLDLLLSATGGTLASSRPKDAVDRITGLNAFYNAGIPLTLVDIAFTSRGINLFTNLVGSNYDYYQGKEKSQIDSYDEIMRPTKFKTKFADKLTNFNPSQDIISIDTDSFDIDSSATFKAGKNSKFIKKKLARKDFDFIYDERKGGLYFNENGADKGFGDGGIIAILKGAPDLTSSDLEFV